jgi:hypothetical protein
MDFGDQCYDIELEVRQPSFLALKATKFEWTQKAASFVKDLSASDETIVSAQCSNPQTPGKTRREICKVLEIDGQGKRKEIMIRTL